jgi:hypothetical protein
MTTDGHVDWTSFYKAVSFYCLLGFAIGTFLFHRYLYIHERDVMQFKDADYCVAYARSQLIPAHVEAAKALIAQGDTQRFEAAMAQVVGILQ